MKRSIGLPVVIVIRGFLRLLLSLRCVRSLGFLSWLLCIFFSYSPWLILLTLM